jgi:hypothetical protein
MKRESFKSNTRKLLGGAKRKGTRKAKGPVMSLQDFQAQGQPQGNDNALPSQPMGRTAIDFDIDILQDFLKDVTTKVAESFTENKPDKLPNKLKSAYTDIKQGKSKKSGKSKGKSKKKSARASNAAAANTSLNAAAANTSSNASAAQSPIPTDNGLYDFFQKLTAKRSDFMKFFKKELNKIITDKNIRIPGLIENKLSRLEKDIKEIEQAEEDIATHEKELSSLKNDDADEKERIQKALEGAKFRRTEKIKKYNNHKNGNPITGEKGFLPQILELKNLEININNFIYLPKKIEDFDTYVEKGIMTEENKTELITKLHEITTSFNPGNVIQPNDLLSYVFDNEKMQNLIAKGVNTKGPFTKYYFYNTKPDDEGNEGFYTKTNDEISPFDKQRFRNTEDIIPHIKHACKLFEFEESSGKYIPAMNMEKLLSSQDMKFLKNYN